MRSQHELTTQLYADIITIDPLGNRFAAQNVNKQGVDHLGPALPEQNREWKQARRAAQRKSNRELLAFYTICFAIFGAFLLGGIAHGGSPSEDIQNVLKFVNTLTGHKS